MHRRNKIGPRTEPWGTPEVTGISDDFSLSKAIHCESLSKNALIQPSNTDKENGIWRDIQISVQRFHLSVSHSAGDFV